MALSQGSPVGYFELDAQPNGHVELAYFGLLPQFIGQGLGSYLLTVVIERAWQMDRIHPGFGFIPVPWTTPPRWQITSGAGFDYTRRRSHTRISQT